MAVNMESFQITAKIFFAFLISSAFVHLSQTSDVCTITMPTDMPPFEPVFLISSPPSTAYEAFKPTGQVTSLDLGTNLLLTCPGSGNMINAISERSIVLTCSAGNTFKDSLNQVWLLNQLGCKSIPTSELRLTSETCSDGKGYVFEAGFSYDASPGFSKVFSICYTNTTEHTFYTHNIINGAAINFNVQESTRRAFRAEGMKFTTTATNTYYTTNNQIARFEGYFGSQQPYVSSSMFMARGHLTPDADFVFGYEQLATYFYSNAAPEFQVINAGNWIRVENLARSVAANFNDDLEIYNGYMGILELPTLTEPKELKAIYLEATEQIEAPKYYFKVLRHVPSDAAIVMITLNNPFAAEEDIDEFCTNVCGRTNLTNSFFTDRTRGYTFCCELDDFKTNYGDLPASLTASNLLYDTNEVSSTTTTVSPSEGCTITMPSDIPNPEPVYIVATPDAPLVSKLLWPTGQYTVLPVDSILTLFCAGSGNKISSIAEQTLALTCQPDGTFYSAVKAQTYALTNLACDRIPNSELLTTSQTCSDGQGHVFEAGFTTDSGFLSTFTICYDNSTEHTHYARSIINGATQGYKISESTRRAFRAEGMRFTTTATNNFYTTNNQIARFEDYFGPAQPYVSSSAFLARGHLTPDADFVFGYEQLATYFYTNAAPEFQVINAGNWIRVENLARSLATQYGSDLLTFTSTLGILRLPHPDTQQLTSIYLDDGEFIEVPLWYYKVLIHPQLPTSIVMITNNNPYIDPLDVNEFCTNVCDAYGLNSPFFTDTTRGYTFCCTLTDFQACMPNLPTFDLPSGWTI